MLLSLRLRWALLSITMIFSLTAAGSISYAINLYNDAAKANKAQKPIVIFTTASDCEYCELLRENIFQFLPNDPRFILREVVMNSDEELIDFNKKSISHRKFTQRYSVDFSPTVLFLDHTGSMLAEPIVGVLTLEYYRYYFDKNITLATAQLKQN